MKKIIVLTSLMILATTAQAKKTKPVVTAPRRNFLDLRNIQFFCGDAGCASDITPLHITACDVDGCRVLTDIVVSTGPVLRVKAPLNPALTGK